MIAAFIWSSLPASFRRSSALPATYPHGSWIIRKDASSISIASQAQAITEAIDAATPVTCATVCAGQFLIALAISMPLTTRPPGELISISTSSPAATPARKSRSGRGEM